MTELELFVTEFRRNMQGLTIPVFEYIENAIDRAWKVVEVQKAKAEWADEATRQDPHNK